MNLRVGVRKPDGSKNVFLVSDVGSIEEARSFVMQETGAKVVLIEIPKEQQNEVA